MTEPASLFEDRIRRFGRCLDCYIPSFKRYQAGDFDNRHSVKFVGVSLTGTLCEVQCEHCKAKILESMLPADTPERLLELAEQLKTRGAEGLLVSGGSLSDCTVPFEPFLPALAEMRERLGLAIAVHTSITSPALARGLAEAGVASAMVDLVGDDETAREVLHLPSAGVLWEALDNLLAVGLRVNPHIVMGLAWGKFRGEYKALEQLGSREVNTLVIVGLRPLKGTPMEHAPTPSLEELVEFLSAARQEKLARPLILGCARPPGRLEYALERAALDVGAVGVAYPAEETLNYARQLGLEPRAIEACCAVPLGGEEF